MDAAEILVLSTTPTTRRQISRALCSGGMRPVFVEKVDEILARLRSVDLLLIDNEAEDAHQVAEVLENLGENDGRVPIVILSLGAPQSLVDLVQRFDVGNLVAKHGAVRAVFPVLDERELLVTCRKILDRDIFGLEKYIGSWGVEVHRRVLGRMSEKAETLADIGGFLTQLACPTSIVPEIVTVADEFIMNAVIHAPRLADGSAKYEHLGPSPSLVLEPHESVAVSYACDGQRLLISITDNFGQLGRKTLLRYLARGFETPLEPEAKASGAGLGLTMSFRSVHQLIFNIQHETRTEVIAGWYLRLTKAKEFRQVGKSFNIFWLPTDERLKQIDQGRDPRRASRPPPPRSSVSASR